MVRQMQSQQQPRRNAASDQGPEGAARDGQLAAAPGHVQRLHLLADASPLVLRLEVRVCQVPDAGDADLRKRGILIRTVQFPCTCTHTNGFGKSKQAVYCCLMRHFHDHTGSDLPLIAPMVLCTTQRGPRSARLLTWCSSQPSTAFTRSLSSFVSVWSYTWILVTHWGLKSLDTVCETSHVLIWQLTTTLCMAIVQTSPHSQQGWADASAPREFCSR